MRVLSLDLDYVMGPSIDLYQQLWWEPNALARWDRFWKDSAVREGHLHIDQSNLLFLFELFLQAIKQAERVSFSYDHDDILFAIDGDDAIELIHVDHHDDVVCEDACGETLEEKLLEDFASVRDHQRVHEGNWISQLHHEGRLKSCVWIANDNSNDDGGLKDQVIAELLPQWRRTTKDDEPVLDRRFDAVFLCLSPQYVPPAHWHYMGMFLAAYEAISGRESKLAFTSQFKYENTRRHRGVQQRLDGMRGPYPALSAKAR